MNFIPLEVSLDEACVADFIRRYHFEEKDKKDIERFIRLIAPRVHPSFHYVIEEDAQMAVVVMTLGAAFDGFQASFLKKGEIHNAYIIDCLGLEYMWAAYDEIDKELIKRTGLFPENYIFVGDKDLPMEELPWLMSELGQKVVSYNEGYMLSPKKSVVFKVPLSQKTVRKHGRCFYCMNENCDMRRA